MRALFVLVVGLGAPGILPALAVARRSPAVVLHDAFFKSASTESPLTRAGATVVGMAAHLAVAPVALAVLLAGCWFLRAERQCARLANPAWLWIACLGSLAIIFATYMVGDLEIHSWLRNSVNRTTIFAQLLLYSEIAVWLVIAVESAVSRADSEPFTSMDSERSRRQPTVRAS